MKYKIGDWIVFTDKEYSKNWKKLRGISLYGKAAKIIYIHNNKYYPYSIEFKENIKGHTSNEKGKNGHCSWCDEKKITLYKDYFKLKKLLEG